MKKNSLILIVLFCLISTTTIAQGRSNAFNDLPISMPDVSHCAPYRYIGPYSFNGTPLYLTPSDNVSLQTIEKINEVLPEGQAVPEFHPEYIATGNDNNTTIKKETGLWITFVTEGAGYTNTLGYYTFDTSNPLNQRPQTEDITIIFPNVSKVNSGGGLKTGVKVKLGDFAPNTAIGWVLIADAWNKGCVSDGQWALFSDPRFNPENDSNLRYHSVLLADATNKRIILGFEDIRRDDPSCDQDFNDALFYITAESYSSIDTENIPEVEIESDVSLRQ